MAIVLGLSPGTRSFGLAMFKANKLVDWEMKTHPEKWGDEKLKKILRYVSRYIDNYEIAQVAIKLPTELPISSAYIQLVGSLNVLFERRGIPVHYYSLSDLKKHFCSQERPNKLDLAECMASKHPHFIHTLYDKRMNSKVHNMKVLEAVAAATYLLHLNSV
ncbi:MAG: hypothetical protein JNK00_13060 [Flavipsychrobacter sp.]|nr:hypothetical protein [Flavipsychrobacter sp.]